MSHNNSGKPLRRGEQHPDGEGRCHCHCGACWDGAMCICADCNRECGIHEGTRRANGKVRERAAPTAPGPLTLLPPKR